MKIGYVGLGAMGGALAGRLVLQHSLTVWDLDPRAVEKLAGAGASTAATLAELGRECDIVLLCLPRSSDVERAVFGPEGLAEGLSPGKIVIDQTSGVPSQTRDIADRLAKAGINMFDAPVAGGVPAAAAGTVRIITSGPQEAFERALPVLKAMSPNVLRCGRRVGDAQAMKTVNNAMNAACRLATLEVAAMGGKMGLSLKTMTEVLNLGSGRNFSTRNMMPAMVAGRSWSDFRLSLMLKDLNQAAAIGLVNGVPMPITQLTRGLLQVGANTLGENARLEQVIDLVEFMSATRIAAESDGARLEVAPPASASASEPHVGFIGLGRMGAALARRLMLKRELKVFDINPEAARALEAEGARAFEDVGALARASDVILLCLPTTADVQEVLLGVGGVGEQLAPGTLIIDQTTGDPAWTRRIASILAKRDVTLVDAPVSGGPRGAVAGTIAILCGGARGGVDRARPILETISPNIVDCGESGNGHVAKLVNNAVAACNRLITYECAAAGYKSGLSIADMSEVINKSSGWSGASERILPVLAKAGQTADFPLGLMVKDLTLATEMGMACGAPMLIANLVLTIFQNGANALGRGENLDAMARLYETAAGVRFTGGEAD